MAYNVDNEVRKELIDIEKGTRGDHIKVTKITNKTSGAVSIDFRKFYTPESGEISPTKFGVRFNSEGFLDVMKALLDTLDVTELQELSDSINEILDGDNSEEESEASDTE